MENNVQRQLIITFLYLFPLTAYLLHIAPVHRVTPHYARGFIVLIIWQQIPATFPVARHPELIALYASAPNHVLDQMLGLPGSCVLLPYVPLYRLRQHQENYCDCAMVHPDEHLSRESRKLTVMI